MDLTAPARSARHSLKGVHLTARAEQVADPERGDQRTPVTV